jgi:hypothetical protein
VAEVHIKISDLEPVKALIAAVGPVVAKWQAMHRCYSSTQESVELAELLDELVRAVREVGT